MKCKICGANLKKEGDICKNCYNEYKNYEELSADDEEKIITINRKFSIMFNLLKSGEFVLILILFSLGGFAYYNNVIGVIMILISLIILGMWMWYSKQRANGTTTIFYETKMKHKSKYCFINNEEIVKYEEITDMAFFQSKSQKMFGIGDIRFYTKGFLNGITVHDIPEVKKNFETIRDMLNGTK